MAAYQRQFLAGETVAEYEDRRARQDAARAKAADSPAELTDDDIEYLSPGEVGDLAARGGAAHLGMGARSPSRRR